jgi:hypothetical protein
VAGPETASFATQFCGLGCNAILDIALLRLGFNDRHADLDPTRIHHRRAGSLPDGHETSGPDGVRDESQMIEVHMQVFQER